MCHSGRVSYRVPQDVAVTLFDLDDTLTNHTAAASAAAWAWAQTIPHWPLDRQATLTRWFELEDTYFPMWRDGRMTHGGQRRERARAFLPDSAGLSDDEADEAFGDYLVHYAAHWQAFGDAASAIDRAIASGRKVGVLTNGYAPQQRRKLEFTGLARPQLVLLATSDLPANKPSPACYQAACRIMAADPAEVLMVGDDPVADIQGALAAGLRAVQLVRSLDLVRPGSTVPGQPTITSLDDLEF